VAYNSVAGNAGLSSFV